MLSVAILGVIFAASTYVMHPWLERLHNELAARTMYHDLHLAQQQAYTQHQNIIVCPSLDLQSCSEQTSPGYLLAILQGDQLRVIKTATFKHQQISLKSSFNHSYILFKSDGSCPFQGSFQMESPHAKTKLVIAHSGRIHLEYFNS